MKSWNPNTAVQEWRYLAGTYPASVGNWTQHPATQYAHRSLPKSSFRQTYYSPK